MYGDYLELTKYILTKILIDKCPTSAIYTYMRL